MSVNLWLYDIDSFAISYLIWIIIQINIWTQRTPPFHCSHSSGFDSLICFSKLPLWLHYPPPPNQPSTKPSVTLPTFLYTSCPDHFKPQGTIKKTNARLYQTLWIHKAPHFIQTLLTIHFFVRYCYLPSSVRMIHRLLHLNLICQISKFK